MAMSYLLKLEGLNFCIKICIMLNITKALFLTKKCDMVSNILIIQI